jgi:catechol 2,3-dioxygenase-like lactoylglutathione lyase family enzyme
MAWRLLNESLVLASQIACLPHGVFPDLPMIIHGLFHVAIKTNDLEATRYFYCTLLGLKEVHRPDFGYPGAWIACPQPGGAAIIHIYAGGPALGEGGAAPVGSAAIDHLSLSCSGFHEFRALVEKAGLDYREFLVPGTTLWQLFVYDPSGVQLELTFEGSVEPGRAPDMSPGRSYVAGSTFFNPAQYRNLGKGVSA